MQRQTDAENTESPNPSWGHVLGYWSRCTDIGAFQNHQMTPLKQQIPWLHSRYTDRKTPWGFCVLGGMRVENLVITSGSLYAGPCWPRNSREWCSHPGLWKTLGGQQAHVGKGLCPWSIVWGFQSRTHVYLRDPKHVLTLMLYQHMFHLFVGHSLTVTWTYDLPDSAF